MRRKLRILSPKYTQYNGRRKPEQLEPDTFSQVNYREADRVFSEWKSLTERAERVYQKLPEDKRDAFFELVLLSNEGLGHRERVIHYSRQEPLICHTGQS